MNTSKIELTKNIDNLTTENFQFYINDNFEIYIDDYELRVRETSRHKKYLIKKKYRRDGYNKRVYSAEQWVEEKDILLTDEMKKEVLDLILNGITFKTWHESSEIK